MGLIAPNCQQVESHTIFHMNEACISINDPIPVKYYLEFSGTLFSNVHV